MHTLLSKHAPRDCVAFGPEGERTASDLLRDAARIAAELPAQLGPGAELLLVFREDRYAFAASLLAAWARGCTAVLPPDTGRETVLALLSRKTTSLALHDTLSGAPLRVDRLLADGVADAPPLDLAALREKPLRVLCFRAGSIGEDDAVAKTGAQLAREVEALLRAFPQASGARVISTITPGHHYGFVFGVLLPLFGGGAFARTVGTAPERLADSVGAQGHGLVSAPRHLAQLLQAAPALVERADWVVSSLTALREGLAQSVRERCGAPVTDVFMSTETGCIAAREAPEQQVFRALADVTLEVREGALSVRSPWSGGAAVAPTSDRVSAAPEGGFVYEGRADLGARAQGVSLQALEARIAALVGVEDVALTFAPRAAAPTLLVAVVGAGLSAQGVAEAVAAHLPHDWALGRVLILESLRRDASGKLPQARLLRHFGLRADGTPVNYHLAFAEAEGASDERGTHRVYTVQVPEDYGYFEGHFPGYPILPGAAQLSELLIPCVRRARPELGAPKQLSRLKFLGRIQPGETVEVALSYKPDEPALEFVLRRGETICAAGHVSFERGEQAR